MNLSEMTFRLSLWSVGTMRILIRLFFDKLGINAPTRAETNGDRSPAIAGQRKRRELVRFS